MNRKSQDTDRTPAQRQTGREEDTKGGDLTLGVNILVSVTLQCTATLLMLLF